MISQFGFAFDGPPQIAVARPERRIDITLDRLRSSFEALSGDERAALASKSWWSAVDTVAHLRAMERGEEEVTGRPCRDGTADTYDRIISPGEHICEALIRVFQTMFTTSE